MQIYYVSPLGNDAWSGTQPDAHANEGPFKSIHHARDVIRQQIASGMTEDIEVQLRGGEYFLDSTVVLTEADSGKDGFQITYRNYPGEQPIIYTGLQVTGWEPHSGSIYKAHVDYPFQTLYENGLRAIKARYPNSGYHRVEAADDLESQLQFRFKPGDVPQIENIHELQVYVWPGGPHGEWNWFTDILPVQSVDFDERTVTLERSTRYIIGSAGSRYFVQGALELLDAPGEFYLDSQEMIVYYWPRQTPIEEQVIIAPTAIRAFAFVGSSRESVTQNIRLEGLELCASDTVNEFGGRPPGGEFTLPNEDGLIYLQNAEQISIINCHIHDTGMHGVFGNQWVQNVSITGCHLHNIGFTGVLFNGAWTTIDAINKGHQVVNNYIHHTGQVIGYGAGVQLSNTGESYVAHNRIYHTPRYAISMKGTWPGIMVHEDVDGIRVREDMVMDFIHTRGNVIEFNDMSRANVDSQDTGVFEGWGVYSAGNTLHNNLIHDSDIPFSFGFGVYLDDEVSNTTVTNNVIYNLQKGGGGKMWAVFYIKGIQNRFYNNIAANSENSNSAFAVHGYLNAPNHDLEFDRNIVYNAGDIVYSMSNWERNKFKSADDNLFYNTKDAYKMRGIPGIRSLSQWRESLDREYDQHSITADPHFMDADHNDFRLRYDSPAYGLGFEDINMVDIGLLSDFAYADPNEALDRLFITNDRVGIKSYVDMHGGEKIHLQLVGRTVSGFYVDVDAASCQFSSSDDHIVAVSEVGIITARGKGVARVTALCQGKQVSLDVLVDDLFDRVEILAPRTQLEMNESMQIEVVGRTAFGQYIQPQAGSITYLSRQPHQAMINHQGVVTGQTTKGDAEIVVIMRVGNIRKQGSITVRMDWESDFD
ncbi:MAG: right-handed parallel beta-helix repeat-containing protein [Anaerolineae bacterium]|nr:right-handed parallel beta-helix repeat-containing protein [Anaerolineae bacterium]